MSDFDERLRRASQQFTQKSATEQKALASKEEARKEFLVDFAFKAHRDIEPVLRQAKEHLQPTIAQGEWSDEPEKKTAAAIGAGVVFSDSEDRVSLTVRHGNVFSGIVFLADPTAALVRITSDSYRYDPGKMDYGRRKEIETGEGSAKTAIAETLLENIKKDLVESWVAGFIERILK